MFAGAHHRIQYGRCLTAHFAADDPPVVATQSDRSQSPLAEVVVNRQITLHHVADQRIPVVQRISDCLTKWTLRQRLCLSTLQPLLQALQYRLRLARSKLAALFFTLATTLLATRLLRSPQ